MLVRRSVGFILAILIVPEYTTHGFGQQHRVAIWQHDPGETAMESQQPTLTMRAKVDGNEIKVGYEVANQLSSPIYVFDRLYDMSAESLAPNWAYVDLSSNRIVLCRQVWPVPTGLHHENPEVPYARVVAPGAKIKGVFAIHLPVTESDPYIHIRTADGAPRVADSSEDFVFRLGWAVVRDVHGGAEVELEGERLVLFPYAEAIQKQKLATSLPAKLPLPAGAAH
jgi:hypothetical protein